MKTRLLLNPALDRDLARDLQLTFPDLDIRKSQIAIHKWSRRSQLLRSRAQWWFGQMRKAVDAAPDRTARRFPLPRGEGTGEGQTGSVSFQSSVKTGSVPQ